MKKDKSVISGFVGFFEKNSDSFSLYYGPSMYYTVRFVSVVVTQDKDYKKPAHANTHI